MKKNRKPDRISRIASFFFQTMPGTRRTISLLVLCPSLVFLIGPLPAISGLAPMTISGTDTITVAIPSGASDVVEVSNPGPGVVQIFGRTGTTEFQTLFGFNVGEIAIDAAINETGLQNGDRITVHPSPFGYQGVGGWVAENEPNGTRATSTALAVVDFASADVLPGSDIDFWSVSGVEAGDLAFAYLESQNSTLAADSTLEVHSNDGALLEADDDDGPAASSVVAGAVVKQTGNLFFQAAGFLFGQAITPYGIYVAIIDPADVQTESEENNSPETATPVLAGMATGDFGHASNDVDFFTFFAPQGTLATAMLDKNPEDDSTITKATLQILDRDGSTLLASGDNQPNRDGEAAGTVSIKESGMYFVRIANMESANSGAYRFVVRVYDSGESRRRDLETIAIKTGSGPDLFEITPSDSVPIFIDGGPPEAAPGDALLYQGNGVHSITDPGSRTGVVSLTGFEDVNYTDIEEVVIQNPTPTPSPTPNFDVRPTPLDGKIDARDLIEWIHRGKIGEASMDLILDFSRVWRTDVGSAR